MSRTRKQEEFMLGVHRFIEENFPRREFLTLQGLPGTGKTSIITEISKEFPELNILYAAFTGKAVDNLMGKGVRADTLHSAFYYVDEGSLSLQFKRKDRTELEEDWDVVIIDEFSMVSAQMVDDILDLGIKLIFVGDKDQLGAVDGGMTTYLDHADYVLDEIMRQSQQSGILRLGMEFRKTGELPPYQRYSEDVAIIPRAKISEEIILKSDQTICGTNATKDYWNEYIRHIKGYYDYLPQVGERLISVKNMKHIQIDGHMVINGTTGTVIECKDTASNYMILAFKPTWATKPVVIKADKNYFLHKPVVNFKNKEIGSFEWGYVITVNKAQGSEWDKVLFIVDKNMPREALRRNINTGISRARKRLIVAY